MLNRRGLLSGGVASGMALAVSAISAAEPAFTDRLSGDVAPVHDPCLIEDETGGFHVFSTSQMRDGKGLIHWRTSPDMIDWTFKGSVMPKFPHWVMTAIPETRGAWAPDIARFNGRYYLYYAASTFGQNRSVIGLMTTPTLDTSDPAFGWMDAGLVVESKPGDTYNAIDPNHVIDADGRHWLSFGSFWSGLKLVELDPATGKRKPGARLMSIAGRDRPDAIEAPFIFRRGDYYYLVASYDFCCRGADSSYYSCVGRSKAVEGPYIDSDGKKLTEGGGRILLHASLDKSGRFKGPGGASVVTVKDTQFIVYHAYDAQKNGLPTLRIQPLNWTADGWPIAV